jgi:predicted chitinase
MPPGEPNKQDDLSAPAGTVEERRLRFEEAKYALERDKFDRERTRVGIAAFVNNNLGIVVSAIVGVATIIVSALQLRISTGTARAQFDLEQSKFSEATAKDERAFAFDFARFLLEKQTELNTTDVNKVAYLRNVVIATLPVDLSTRVSRSMADSATSETVRAVWLDGFVKLQLAAVPSALGVSHVSITAAQVVTQFPQIASPIQQARLKALLDAAAEAGMDDPRVVATVLAVVLPQTGFLSTMVENLNYNSVSRILAVWPGRITQDEAAGFVHQPEALANRVYGNSLGNREPDDGWRYRGRGFLGTTGRTAYERSSQLIGVDLIANPEMLAEDRIAAHEAVAMIKQIPVSPGDIVGIVRRINGGLNGLAEAQSILEKLLPGGTRVTEGLAVTGSGKMQAPH